MDDQRVADGHRTRILHFNNELLRDIKHTKEEYIEVLAEIDAYERYCAENKNYPNNRAVLAIEAQKAAIDLKGKLLAEALDNVITAVKKTNQKYVDTLKESNTFTIDNQKEALKKSMQTAVEIMRQEVKDFISAEYGNLDKWLDTQIEAAVNTVKTEKGKTSRKIK